MSRYTNYNEGRNICSPQMEGDWLGEHLSEDGWVASLGVHFLFLFTCSLTVTITNTFHACQLSMLLYLSYSTATKSHIKLDLLFMWLFTIYKFCT